VVSVSYTVTVTVTAMKDMGYGQRIRTGVILYGWWTGYQVDDGDGHGYGYGYGHEYN
jgi:hypothetical protein